MHLASHSPPVGVAASRASLLAPSSSFSAAANSQPGPISEPAPFTGPKAATSENNWTTVPLRRCHERKTAPQPTFHARSLSGLSFFTCMMSNSFNNSYLSPTKEQRIVQQERCPDRKLVMHMAEEQSIGICNPNHSSSALASETTAVIRSDSSKHLTNCETLDGQGARSLRRIAARYCVMKRSSLDHESSRRRFRLQQHAIRSANRHAQRADIPSLAVRGLVPAKARFVAGVRLRQPHREWSKSVRRWRKPAKSCFT